MSELKPIAHIETDFPTKFGVPRQSGLVAGLKGRLLWDFSEARRDGMKWRPTVRPPRLGGNKRVGVFATRSPYRPNNIGLSSVRILSINLHTPDGPVIEVEGADLMSGTPIFDIKPYLAFTDSHPDATGGFTEETFNSNPSLESVSFTFNSILTKTFDPEHLKTLKEILLSDPRPHYHDDPDRVYALEFAGKEVKFRIKPNHIEAWIE